MFNIIKMKNYDELTHYVYSSFSHIYLPEYEEITDFVVLYKIDGITNLYAFAYKTDKITVIALPNLTDITTLMSKKILHQIDIELRQLFLF